MYFRDNPVLQRELLVNLRMGRAFLLLFAYLALLSAVVYVQWPSERIDVTNPAQSQRLMNLFFLGQYLLASLMAPSFAAGSITGEKERQTYEMLLASPLRPGAVLLGKFFASLCHLALLIFCSLPIVMLCLPLGGTSLYELLASYVVLILSIATFGMISLTCSGFFARTSAALVVSYMLILPLAIVGASIWYQLGSAPTSARLWLAFFLLPIMTLLVCIPLFVITSRRLLHPPDVGSEGKDVVDEQREMREAVGLVIQRDKFPDRLFAPAKRDDLLADGANPMYDKEMHSELFAQGTLMLRVVIQVSMLVAIPMMGIFLYFMPEMAAWYVCYVVMFNVLVGPVFSAGSVTSERERQTLDLLLTTTLSPMQILSGKLFSGLRVSTVLTSFLIWPLLLAFLMVTVYWATFHSLLAYVGLILMACQTTATIALFCSVLFKKTSISLMTSYLVLIVLFAGPVAVEFFTTTFYEAGDEVSVLTQSTVASPFTAAFAVPLEFSSEGGFKLAEGAVTGNWTEYAAFMLFYTTVNSVLLVTMATLFSKRWSVAR